MPRAGPSRSQRNASQSQPAPSQSQARSQRGNRAARRQRIEDSEEEEAEGDEDEEGVKDESQTGAASDLEKRKASVVRLAIFHEQKRLPLKREEITKKVLGAQRGGFKQIFDGAQHILRTTFGMELVELQTRIAAQENAMGLSGASKRKRGAEGPSQSQAGGATQKVQDAVAGPKKRGGDQGAKAFILRSVLDSELIELAGHTDPKVLEVEMADSPDAFNEGEIGARCYGSLLAWNSGDTLGALGVLHVVLALILVNGKVINDAELRAYLKRLRLTDADTVDFPAIIPNRTMPVDNFLSDLVRKQYLDRTKLGGAAGGKRGRASQTVRGADGEDVTYEWRWGPRAFSEIGESAVARFIAEFMAERRHGADMDSSSDDEGANGRARRARQKAREEEAEKRLQALMRGIERAAGGDLLDLV